MEPQTEPQFQQELKHLEDLTEENNVILKKMQRAARWSTFFQYVYWIVIIAVAVGAVYYLQPVFNKLNEIYTVFKKF